VTIGAEQHVENARAGNDQLAHLKRISRIGSNTLLCSRPGSASDKTIVKSLVFRIDSLLGERTRG